MVLGPYQRGGHTPPTQEALAVPVKTTPEQFTRWVLAEGLTTPDKAVTQDALNAAALLVADYLTRMRPLTDPDAERKAVFVQARYWLLNDITPMSEDVQTGSKVIASSSLLGASMTYADAQTTVSARVNAANGLCLEARLLLGLAGARPAHPTVIG